MHIHILGICGTFMGGLAVLAKQLGYRVTGSDANVYPPMSTQLEQQGIELTEGYDPSQLELAPDLVTLATPRSTTAYVYDPRIGASGVFRCSPQHLHMPRSTRVSRSVG